MGAARRMKRSRKRLNALRKGGIKMAWERSIGNPAEVLSALGDGIKTMGCQTKAGRFSIVEKAVADTFSADEVIRILTAGFALGGNEPVGFFSLAIHLDRPEVAVLLYASKQKPVGKDVVAVLTSTEKARDIMELCRVRFSAPSFMVPPVAQVQ